MYATPFRQNLLQLKFDRDGHDLLGYRLIDEPTSQIIWSSNVSLIWYHSLLFRKDSVNVNFYSPSLHSD